MTKETQPAFIYMLGFSIVGIVGYFTEIFWLVIIGGIGLIFYAFIARKKVTSLHMATYKGDSTFVSQLIAEGHDVNARQNDGNTPLHVAVQINNSHIAEMLLIAGADIDTKNNKGNTPLSWAAVFNATEVTNFLIAQGADIIAKNNEGKTPFDRAILNGNFSVAKILEKHHDKN